MIRTVVVLFAFSILICMLIIFRPFSGGDDQIVTQDPLGTPVEPDVEVTRAAQNDMASLAEAALADVADITPATAVVAAPRPTQIVRPDTDDTSLNDMTQNVLAELGFVGVETVVTPGQEQLQTTANILAGIEAATGQQTNVPEHQTLESIVVAALRAGQSDDEIDALVNAAAADGTVAVPQIMVTSEGRVDTHVLLSNIVVQAQIAAGNVPAVPNTTPDNTQGLEVRVVQRATDSNESRFYTVQPGDSLGAISAKFYGQAALFGRIYEANRQSLSSPDQIRVGQRLLIPHL